VTFLTNKSKLHRRCLNAAEFKLRPRNDDTSRSRWRCRQLGVPARRQMRRGDGQLLKTISRRTHETQFENPRPPAAYSRRAGTRRARVMGRNQGHLRLVARKRPAFGSPGEDIVESAARLL